jgi:hypothetical protein
MARTIPKGEYHSTGQRISRLRGLAYGAQMGEGGDLAAGPIHDKRR